MGQRSFAEHRHELLDEERVAAAALDEQSMSSGDGSLRDSFRTRSAEDSGVERVEVEHEEVVAAGLRCPTFLELGTGRREQHDRQVAQPFEHRVDEVEDELIGPVDLGQRR